MKNSVYDEMTSTGGTVREHYRRYDAWLHGQTPRQLADKRAEADLGFHRVGITFAVYGDQAGTERLIPFDIIPRVIPAAEWQRLDAGLRQRVRALNLFIRDIYHEQAIVKARIVPSDQILANAQYRPEMRGVRVPGDIYAHIAGIDVVRAGEGEFYVLEDNLRVPSGVSYMLENRKMMMRLFPDLFIEHQIAPVAHYPDVLLDNLRSVAPTDSREPTVVLLTPGAANSAYFEHAFLAQQMGIELVEGQDLFVADDTVFMRTTQGPQRVDVIYRRIDDDFLDPLAFRADSVLGVPGLLSVYRAGRVTLANAIGTGVADDKSIYPFVPDMIRFYLGEEPLLNNVRTWQLRRPDDCAYVLEHLASLVVKETHGAGGYGMLIGPAATVAEIEQFRARIAAEPSRYIAQPTLSLSSCPTFVAAGIAPRHIDLRPFVLSGRQIAIVPGGLTRVALREGSLVVNSSQGGGTKDTWVLEDSMLSRTADNLFWMARYTERAENTARMLDVTCQTALLPRTNGPDVWGAPLRISELEPDFIARYGTINRENVLEFMVRDPLNPSSIHSCVRTARENARAVRGAVTTEVWETANETWLEIRRRLATDDWRVDPSLLFERVKTRSHLSRGVTIGTMLRDVALHFIRLGTFLERADNTARILDVKFHEAQRPPAVDGSSAEPQHDYYHWTALLRSVSALEVYRKVYRDVIVPSRVAELLVLNGDMPRSLMHCVENVVTNLDLVRNARSGETRRRAGLLHAQLLYGRVSDILTQGLHAYLTEFLERIYDLGNRVSQDFLVPAPAT